MSTRLPRALGAFLFVLVFYALLIAAAYFLCRIVCDEAATDELKHGTYKYFKDIEKDNL